MVHSTKSIQNWLVTEISKWKHIERILTSEYISNGNLWLPLSSWYQDTEEKEALAIRKDLEIVASIYDHTLLFPFIRWSSWLLTCFSLTINEKTPSGIKIVSRIHKVGDLTCSGMSRNLFHGYNELLSL